MTGCRESCLQQVRALHPGQGPGKRLSRWLEQAVSRRWFAVSHWRLRKRRKILYALTPTHPNVGDHAQAVAIRRWLDKHFPDLPVIEASDRRAARLLPVLQWLIRDGDIVFLHSGGNLGDRYPRIENTRRALVAAFPRNRVISLPQTISFSDTDRGRAEREVSQRVYNAHPDLTIMGRDERSAGLAHELFPKAHVLCVPDFVLSLNEPPTERREGRAQALLCFRRDEESALSPAGREAIGRRLPCVCTAFDTTVGGRVRSENREALLEQTLERFRSADLVVTDRLHGVVFAVLCRKACVVLPTVDHKLTASVRWFDDVSFVALASSLDAVPAVAERCLAMAERTVPDWNALYFDRLPEQLGL